MSSGNAAASNQAVKLGELKMAENLVKQRVEATLKAVNEAEGLRLEEVKRTVEKEKGLEKSQKMIAAMTEKVGVKIAAMLEEDRLEAAAVAERHRAELQAIGERRKAKNDKVKADLEVAKAAHETLKEEISEEVAKRGAAIKQKGAAIRAHLNQEQNKLNDQLYATILPDNLKQVVDLAPRIGNESKFAELEFKK